MVKTETTDAPSLSEAMGETTAVVTTKEAKVVEPALPKKEADLVRSISGRMRRFDDNRLSLAIELGQLKELVDARNENWNAYVKEHLRKPDGTPWARTTIAELVNLNKDEDTDVVKALEDMRRKKKERARELRKRQKEKNALLKTLGEPRKAKNKSADRDLTNLDVFQVACGAWARGKPDMSNSSFVTIRFTRQDFATLNQKLGRPHAEE